MPKVKIKRAKVKATEKRQKQKRNRPMIKNYHHILSKILVQEVG